MTEVDPMARSGAIWCETHRRWECASAKKHHATAIRGMALCKNCAGTSTEVAKAKGQANLLTWSLLADDDPGPLMDPAGLVLRALRLAVMQFELISARLRLQVEEDDATGLIGPTYAAGRDGARVETGEDARALVKLKDAALDRVVRYAKTAHDMGIDARRLELEQAQASIVVTAVGLGLDALALGAEARDVFLRTFLGAIGRPAELDAADDQARHIDTEEASA
jgi:hypothetical protein